MLRIEQLRKSYHGTEVLRGIDLTVEPGQVVCLIGASGSGKSTLLRCLNLLETVDDGTVWLADESGAEQDVTDPRVDVDGVRRRTRALAGRCQGFHCGAVVTGMIEAAHG